MDESSDSPDNGDMTNTANPTAPANPQAIADLIERQTTLVETLYIARTDSPAALAFWQLQVGTLDDLIAFERDEQFRASVARVPQ